MIMECKKEQNLSMCTCTYSCSRKGICCDCVAYHRRADQLPGCFFPKDAEKTYDRSYAYFAHLVNEGKIK
jgi:hypothetical protein